jgi:hypothetical protein
MMTSGVYARATMTRDYRGHARVRMRRRRDGFGTEAVVLVRCRVCACEMERSGSAVRLAARESREFTCLRCNARATHAKRRRGIVET